MRIIGIDPALTCLGYGLIEKQGPKIKYISSGLIKTKPSDEMHKRLNFISSSMQRVMELYQPDAIAMEETFVNKNPSTSLKLGYVRGALMSVFGATELPYFEYKPNKIKKSIVGVGHAEKGQIIHMVRIVISGTPQEITSDEADALATAYTTLVHETGV